MGKEQKITITNDKGRLSEEEIERMVSEGEKYKAEDDANKNRIEAKNGLENYCYSLKSSISSPEVEGKIPADDKKKLEDAIEETIKWLDENLSAEKEEFEEKQKSLEGIAMPILQAMGGGEGGMSRRYARRYARWDARWDARWYARCTRRWCTSCS